MIRQQNEQGSVNVCTSVYSEIAGNAASNCFGVKGMQGIHVQRCPGCVP